MGDFIFANLIFNYTGNDADGQSIATASLINQSPILEKPNDYYGFISRLVVSGFNTPLLIPQIVTNQSNPNLTVYNVALYYNGIYSDPISVIYVPPSNNLQVPSAVGQYQDVSTNYYYIYNYNALCSMFNTAFSTALDNLNGKITTGTGTPPMLYYDPTYGIVLKVPVADYGQDTYSPDLPNDTVQIFINSSSAPFFNGQNLSLLKNTTNCNWRILLYPMVANLSSDGSYYISTPQNLQETNNIPSIQKYQVITNMPIVQEYTAVPQSIATPAIPYDQTSILTDLAPDNSNPVSYGTEQIYNQVSSLRLFDITGSKDLYQLSATINWTDQFGRTYPLLLGYGVQASIKFGFIKKSVYKGGR